MNRKAPDWRFAAWVVIALALSAIVRPLHAWNLEPGSVASAQAAFDQPGSVELEEFLFVQAPPSGAPKDAIVLVWLPQPLQKLCLSRTAHQCATIDYCIRTTNRDVAMCRNLGVNLARIRPYPPDTRPRRMISLTLSRIRPMNGNGFDLLQNYYQTAPPGSLQRLSMNARVKARIQFIRKPDDDDFNLLQIIAAPPF